MTDVPPSSIISTHQYCLKFKLAGVPQLYRAEPEITASSGLNGQPPAISGLPPCEKVSIGIPDDAK
tara:strand:- start:445 stop:642 length:198 start_codon:yes stop_codon:yes gene_type:complete